MGKGLKVGKGSQGGQGVSRWARGLKVGKGSQGGQGVSRWARGLKVDNGLLQKMSINKLGYTLLFSVLGPYKY